MSNYDPREPQGVRFSEATPAFRDGSDTPTAYLERCIEQIERREPEIRAFVALNLEAARAAAESSTTRWRAEAPLSAIDGMPIGIKDLLETKDMPTEYGCAAYRGNFPKRDNAAVWALREAGAVIVGKTVTAELGGSEPGPTQNPFDPSRTPGGSSSGTAAAVAAGMLPAGIGTQVGGSIIRPAAFCGNIALKPSQGAINRGERQATSMSTHGVHANSIEDMWQVAIEIANRAGGDRGYPGLQGPDTTPEPARPERLIVLQTEGWPRVEEPTRRAFMGVLDQFSDAGVKLLTREDHPLVESLERSIQEARRFGNSITAWENRWAQRSLVDEHPGDVSERTQEGLRRAEALTPEDYRDLLLEREVAQRTYAAVAPIADAVITLSCPGPAPFWTGDVAGEPRNPRPTGDPVFNMPSSLLFAPAVTTPLLAVDGLPVGVQIMGHHGDDAKVTGFARWALATLRPVASPN